MLSEKDSLKTIKSTINSEIMDQVISILNSTFHGNVTLVFQDSRLVQMERNEKIRPLDVKAGKKQMPQGLKENCDVPLVRGRILEACETLEYGQVVIGIKEAKIIQIDRTEKQRFSSMVGVYGDGI